MKTNERKQACDERLLRGYLDDALSPTEQQLVENHLCRCQPCRDAISDSAAEQDWWGRAGEYLRGDPWDVAAETDAPLPQTELPQTELQQTDPRGNSGDGRHPLAIRQIKGWLDPTDDPRMLGRFGGYEIVGVVGQGGMGVVLKGFESSLNRYVAIKVLSPLLAASGAARKRFAREAKATAAVLHENVIPIHRVDEAHDLPYLVMPYVSDKSLQKRIDDQGPLSLVAILRIGEQIAAGLAAAHAHGLVHRDIKPANILLENGVERVRITDFGLARAVDDGSLTRTGVIAGTPQYMSPEQARGENLDARSDLFSLGSVLYAMCTGRLPFRAETPYGILRRITDTEPRSIREINPDIPPWLEAIVARLHAKRAEDRWASATDVAELLRQCLTHVEQPTVVALPDECQPPRMRRPTAVTGRWRSAAGQRFPRPALMLLSAVVLVAVVGGLIVGRGLLTKLAEPNKSPVETIAVGDTPPADVTSLDDDLAIGWNQTAEDIARMRQAAAALEARSQQLWETQPTDPALAPKSDSHVTSAQESKP